MAYDEGLAERIRDVFMDHTHVTEKKMFGGLCFMLSGNMCCGIVGDTLMARVGPEAYSESLKQKHAREMDFTGKPMKGMVYVSPAGIETDDMLAYWLGLCMSFATSLPVKKAKPKVHKRNKSVARGK